MRHLLQRLDNFKKDLGERVRIANSRDLFLSFEVENIIDSAVLATTASLERQESRWGFWHFRGDRPNRDDAQWLKHIDLIHNAETDAPAISYRPIQRLAGIGAA
jgi:succinate dehydrogenase/fumarate reductase flavoprotein subunit